MRIQFIYFDLGWTLIDEIDAHKSRAKLTVGALSQLGMPISASEFLAMCYRAGQEGAASPYVEALSRLGAAPEFQTRHGYDHREEKLYPGVHGLLTKIRAEYRLGVIANQSLGAEDRMRAFGIRDFFEVVLSSAEMGLSKPDSRLFDEAERLCGLPAHSIAMVGDSLENDIRPALQRGWLTVRVLQGFFRDREIRRNGCTPHATISRIQDLPNALSKLQK